MPNKTKKEPNIGLYILRGKKTVPCPDVLEWGKQFAKTNRIVAQDTINDFFVSTVFLGIDHSFGNGKPLLFETMIFKLPDNEDYQQRYSTWEEAQIGHGVATSYAKLIKKPGLFSKIKKKLKKQWR